jgi:hypothetical protein
MAQSRHRNGGFEMTEEKKSSVDLDAKEEELDEADFITLEFDDGEEIECEIMGVFEVEGKEYIALIPDDETDDVYIYGYVEISEEEFELLDIDDDEEFAKVVAEFDKLTAEE